MNFQEWSERYFPLYRPKLKPKTREGYDLILSRYVLPHIGPEDLREIQPDTLQEILNQVEARAGSRQAQICFALLHAMFARARKSRHVAENVADLIDKPEHRPKPGRAISAEDWELLQEAIDGDLAFALMAYAGLRRGEVLGLQWQDCDLARGVLRIQRARVRIAGEIVTQAPKSAAGCREIPIRRELLPLIRASMQLQPRAFVVRCSPETLARRWRRAQAEAGIAQPYRLHDIRHTYATQMRAMGCNLSVLQYLMGHSSFELTANTYTHIGITEAVKEVRRCCG